MIWILLKISIYVVEFLLYCPEYRKQQLNNAPEICFIIKDNWVISYTNNTVAYPYFE